MRHKHYNQDGQSLLELLVAMVIFILVISSIMFLVLDAHSANRQGGERTKAALYAQEGYEAVRSIANRGWRNMQDGTFGITSASGQWELQASPSVLDNQYTRSVTIAPVYRDETGAIVDSGGAIDVDTKRVITDVTWNFTASRPERVTTETYITNWRSTKWVQTTKADFDQGTLATVVTASVDGGEVQLEEAQALSFLESTFDTATDYTFDANKIDIADSHAQLKDQSTVVSGDTTNPGFDTVLTPWQYADWDQGIGEVNVTGSRVAIGGNPGAYARIAIPRGQDDLVGGYFQQSFAVTESDSTAYVQFDNRVVTFPSSPTRLQAYVFVDSAPGAPVIGTEVWTSGPLTGTTPWASFGPIDISGIVATPGTYYVKLAVWVDTTGGRAGAFNVAFDNALVHWEKAGTPSYPTDRPTVQPVASMAATDIYTWHSFIETATKNGGEIYYQLSDDDGATWQYWTGSAWNAVKSAADSNTASDINAHITAFPAAAQRLLFKAFLSSDGTQQVMLDTVRVTYEAVKTFYSTFDAPTDYTFDSNKVEVISSQAQLKNQSVYASGDTTNPGFDTVLTPWQYADWDQGGGEVNVTGSRIAMGGNPGAYARISIPRGSRDEVGGFLQQRFDTTEDNPDSANVSFDMSVLSFSGTPLTLQAYVFVDSAPGAPVIGTEVWTSGPLTGTTPWASFGPIDIRSFLPLAGTYYVKLAVWVETGPASAGAFNVAFDNALVHWEKAGTPSYPTDRPTVQPVASMAATDIY
ncbi:MAG: prepilin-type N-terminal cleavage/methylation domain-containing protein, partial [Patescibacteria group bacterium]|nr:prepilin-type N-terminal cleavage/methylation domain-containing protein [Patescibacteria group bacterium]